MNSRVKLGRNIFLAMFVLAALARLIRIFAPHGAGHHEVPHEAPAYVTGEVVSVEPDGRGFVLHSVGRGGVHDTHVEVEPNLTQVRLGAETVDAGDIRTGDHATVSFTSSLASSGVMVAKEVRLARAAAPP